MKIWRAWWMTFVMLCSMGCATIALAQQTTKARTHVEILRIGDVDLARSREVVLADGKFDIVGRAPGHEADGRLHALARPHGENTWMVAASAHPAPGGVFRLSGLNFPTTGKYELTVGHFDRALDGTAAYSDPKLEELSRGLSQRVTVTIRTAPHPMPPKPGDAKAPIPEIAIVEVGGLPATKSPLVVPSPTEVVLRIKSFDKEPKIFLAALAPHTQRVWIYGPAVQHRVQTDYVVPVLPLTVPGNFQQTRFDLIAFSSKRPVTTGPTDVNSFRAMVEHSSRPLTIIAEDLTTRPDSAGIADLSITRIGDHEVRVRRPEAAGQSPAQRDRAIPPLKVQSGDSVEVGDYRNIPQGAQIWILTRPRGSPLWFVQGVASLPTSPGFHAASRSATTAAETVTNRQGIVRGDRETVARANVSPVPPVVLAAARFQSHSNETAPNSKDEHDVLAVVALDTLPRTWIASSSLAASSIVSVSQIVRVEVDSGASTGTKDLGIAITRIGQKRVSAQVDREEYRLLPRDSIELSVRGQMQESMHVYVATGRADAENWWLHEVLGTHRTYTAPDVPFEHDDADENTAFKIVAILTEGALAPSERKLGTSELKERALAMSDVVLANLQSDDRQNARSSVGNRISRGMGMWAIWLLLATTAIALVALAVWAVRRFPHLARRGTDRVASWLDRYDKVFEPDDRIHPAEVALGSILLGVLLYAILAVYLPLFADTIAEALKFTPQRAFGLAVLIVLSTGFTGVLMHLLSDTKQRSSMVSLAFLVVVFCAAGCLIYFQASLFRIVMPTTFPAWFSFALIPLVEALGIYFATKFLWSFVGLVLYVAFRIPLMLLHLVMMIPKEIDLEPTGRNSPATKGVDE